MKVFLLQDVEHVGIAGELLTVKEGYALNYLIPRKFAVQITPQNESFYKSKIKQIEHRKDVIASKTSMMAEKIKGIKVTLAKKMHDDGKLYGSVSPAEVVALLEKEGIAVSKSQIKIEKSIKEKGEFPVTIKLTSKIQSQLILKVVPEKGSH